jgi:hypothetical protein
MKVRAALVHHLEQGKAQDVESLRFLQLGCLNLNARKRPATGQGKDGALRALA